MKNKSRFYCLFLCFVFSLTIFVGCSSNKELNKASKNLNRYEICAQYDENNIIYATEKVNYINKTKTILSSICFNLYPRAFRENAKIKPYTSINEAKCFPSQVNYGDIYILYVKENGEQSSFSFVGQDENAMEIKLNKELEPNNEVEIEIDFKVILTESTHRLGYYDYSVNIGNWYPILAEFENGEYNLTPYYSTGDPFFSSVANYEVLFTYPSDYFLGSTGEVLSVSFDEDKTTAKLCSSATRDFAITLTMEECVRTKKVNNIEVTYVGYKEDENIDFVLDTASKALDFFSKTFGKYPYNKLDIVKSPFVHGGMEYPSLVIISDSLTDNFDIAKVVTHEIAHQWWYGVVGNNEISEAWLDESLAEYSTILFFEEHSEYGISYEDLISEAFASYVLYADIISSINGTMKTSMLLNVFEYNSEYEYSYMIYVRGTLMMDSIRQLVGKNNVVKALKKYYKQYKFKIATTDDLIECFNSVCKKGIDKIMDSWLSGNAIVGAIN